MKFFILFLIFILLSFQESYIFASNQKKGNKFDSTLKIGKVGYRIFCANKTNKSNSIRVKMLGFIDKDKNRAYSGPKEITIPLNGTVSGAEIDDLDADGFPDLLIYIAIAQSDIKKVIGIRSINNEKIEPIEFPDILDDPKLSIGYKGLDNYYLLEGMLIRSFPIQLDSNSHTNHNYRKIFYRLQRGEKFYRLVPLRNLETDKP